MKKSEIIIKPLAIIRFLVLVTVIISAISFSTRFIVYYTDYTSVKGLKTILSMFYVGAERNIPTAFSAMLLLSASLLLLVIAILKWEKPKSFYLKWLLLSLGFFYLAMDEAMILHETILGQKEGVILGRQFSGFLRHAWIIPFLFTIPFLIWIFYNFLMNLERKTRILFIVSAAIYVGGAVGIESIGGYIKDTIGVDNWWYYLEVAVEEGFEMAGVIVFIYALLDYLYRNYQEIKFIIIKQ